MPSVKGKTPTRDIARAPTDDRSVIRFSGVEFSWAADQTFKLHIPALEIRKGEKLLLVGPSGSGKSTLLSLLTGIVAPDSGEVRVLDTNIAALGAHARDGFRAEHFGIIFQMFNLLPYGSVIDNVILPLNFTKVRKARVEEKHAINDEARRLLTRLGIDREIQDRKTTSQLSVGQQQRVASARALIGRPEIIVADEPTSALDRMRQTAFLDLLFEEVDAAEATLIMVSHDESLGTGFDRIARLDDIISNDIVTNDIAARAAKGEGA